MLTAVVANGNPADRRRLATLLRLAGWRVEQTAGRRAALLAAAAVRPGLVVTEQALPGGTGLELLEQLRQAGCPARFLLVTTAPTAHLEAAAAAAGTACLAKPVDPRELVAFLRSTHIPFPEPAPAVLRVPSNRTDDVRAAVPAAAAPRTGRSVAALEAAAATVVRVDDDADLTRRLSPRRRRTAAQAGRGVLGPYRLIQLMIVLLLAMTARNGIAAQATSR